MTILYEEDSQQVLKNKVHLPDKVVAYLKRLRNAYGDKYLKQVPGGKILIANTEDKQYNQKSDDKVNDKEKNSHDIPISVAKERIKMQNACQPGSLQDVLMGGQLVKGIMQRQIKSARNKVAPNDAVPQVPKLVKDVPDSKDLGPDTIEVKNGTVTLTKENRSIYITEDQISIIQNIIK